MPRKSKGARLYVRNGIYQIRDGETFVSTRTRERGEAEKALAAYIATKGASGPATPDRMTVADVLAIYAEQHAPHTAAPEQIAYAIQALVPFLGGLPVESLNGPVCRRYHEARAVSAGTVRRELATLQAAINHCVREGHLTAGRQLTLPAKPPPRDRWLTRKEVADLIRTARRDPKTRHVARFILIAVYTGTRSSAIQGLRFMPHTGGGYVDTETGIMYRRAAGKAETKKRTPTVPVPPRLLAHLRRWERMGSAWAVEFRGAGVANIKVAWGTVLKRSGIDHCTKHDLRHTAATWLMSVGTDLWAAAGFLGMDVETLKDTYGHHHPDHMRDAVEAFDRMRMKG